MQHTTKNVVNLLTSAMFALQECELKTGGKFDDANDSTQDAFDSIMQLLLNAQKQCKKQLK
jgi:hypothetical protein